MWWCRFERQKDTEKSSSTLHSAVFLLISLLFLSSELLLKHVLLRTGVCFCVPRWLYMLHGEHFNSFLPRSKPSLRYVWNERRPSLAVPSADSRESRSLCGSRGGTKTFPLEELWVPVDKEGSAVSPGRVYMLVYSGDLRSSRGLHFPDNKWWLYK